MLHKDLVPDLVEFVKLHRQPCPSTLFGDLSSLNILTQEDNVGTINWEAAG